MPDSGETPEIPTAAADDEIEEGESRASIRSQRLARVEEQRAAGREPYPHRFDTDRTIGELRASFGHLEAGEETETRIQVAGRLMLKREQGRLTFGQLRDRTGEVQLFVSAGVLGKERFAEFNELDRGDWVGVEGIVMVTKKGELSVKVDLFELLAKSLRPLPDKWKGLADVDARYRQRYVDLVVNADARRVFEVRMAALDGIRQELRRRDFLEVETPILNLQQGGATARPFVTHYNALDLDTYLRIALELPLKRLLVGGLDRIFEIGRVFRNEGIDTRHNPEFTMLEAYQAFGDYTEMVDLTEALVAAAATAANRNHGRGAAGPDDRPRPTVASRHDGRAHPGGRRRRDQPLDGRRRRRGRCSISSDWPGRTTGVPVAAPTRCTTSSSSRRSPHRRSCSTTRGRRHRSPSPTGPIRRSSSASR